MQGIKLLLFIGNLDSGGAERVVSTLATAWSKSGMDVTICLTTNDKVYYELDSGVKLIFLPRGHGLLQKILNIRRTVRNVNPTSVIAFLPHINILVLLASIGLGKNIVISERIHPKFYRKHYLVRFLRYTLYGISDKIVFQTEDARVALSYLFKRNSKDVVIPNPCDDVFFSGKVNYNSKLILNVGRLTQQKRQHLLISYFSMLCHKFNDWRLLIVGNGECVDDLNEQIRSLGLSDKVQILDSCTEMVLQYANSSIFCQTSEFEGFPNALMEAMAMGLATISYDCLSGPRDLTKNGDKGILVSMDDTYSYVCAMELLMQSVNIRRGIGLEARSHIMGIYSVKTIVDEWNKLLE